MLPEAVAQYLETIPVAQRPIYDRLWQLIARHHPGAEVKLWYRMPTFKTDQGWVSLATQKHHVSLYTCGGPWMQVFQAKHPKIKTGKGCLRFTATSLIPEEDLIELVQAALEGGRHELV